jgi:uncharacterized membrane protein
VSGKRYKKRRITPATPAKLEPPKTAESTSSITARYQAEFFSGPVPPPSLLAKYNDVVPNGAERLMAMAERQSAHRESMESQVVSGNVTLQKQGNNRAFILALVVILGGIYLMATGKSGWGFAAIITSLTSLVSVFAIAKADQRKERVEKSTALTQRRNR